MAKRLLEFDNELIDIRDIKQVSKGFKYSRKEQTMVHTLEINTKYPEGKIPFPVFIFEYATEELLSNKYEAFKIALEDEEGIEIILST